jgi:hypothetical protein
MHDGAKGDHEAAQTEVNETRADQTARSKRRDKLNEQLQKLGPQIQHAEFFVFKVPNAFAMSDGQQPADMPITIRGNSYVLGGVVPRGATRVASWGLFPAISVRQSGRWQLADWLADKSNPLTRESR